MSASTRVPAILGNQMSDRAKKTLDIVEKFVNEECIPADAVWSAQIAEARTEEGRWCHPPIIEELKIKAKKLGLWNMFLAKGHYKEGAGFTNLEYGLMCEQFGRSKTASEASFKTQFPMMIVLTIPGHQQCRPRHRQHGSPSQIRKRGAES